MGPQSGTAYRFIGCFIPVFANIYNMAPPAPPERLGVFWVGPIREMLTMPQYDISF